ncbi:ABC transporter permease [Mollicutes bacterium LVI A0039]|nr:ABC transporter permease [Mollicutes bacterium LVI A0039]
MNIFKRALINIVANKGKTLLLLVIFLTSMFAITMTSIVNETYDKLLAEAFPNGDIPVEVIPAMPKSRLAAMRYDWSEEKKITQEMYDEIGKLPSISRVEERMSSFINLENYEVADNSTEKAATINFTNDVGSYTEESGYKLDYDTNLYSTEERAVIVSDEFLDNNNLSVGDKITLNLNPSSLISSGGLDDVDELKAMEYTVVGTFEFEPTQQMIDRENQWAEKYDYEPDLDFTYLENSFIMPTKNAEEIKTIAANNGADDSEGPSIITTTNLIYIKSLSELSDFKSEVKKITGFDVDVDVSFESDDPNTDFTALQSIIMARNTIQNVFIMLISVVVVMLIIIAIILVRGRRKEIGILVALGERRRNIYFQIVFEQTIVMVISTLVAFPIANIVIRQVANKFGAVQLPFVIAPLFIAIVAGFAIVIVSTLIPAIYTLRVNPKKILL